VRVTRRLRAQGGFTIVEMVVATFILGIVVTGALTMMQVVLRQSRGVTERTDAAQHGRLGLDQMTRQIRSQVCKDQFTRGLIAAGPNSISFYADLGDGRSKGPSMRTLQFDPAGKRVTETVYDSKTKPPLAPTYGPSPDRNKVTILQDVVPDTDAADNPLPFFSYFAYETTNGKPAPTKPLPTAGPLAPADIARAALVRVRFKVRPTGASDDTFAVRMQDDVFFRNADPNAARPDPTCN
jgi:prepilin-type N-terminal cleavage/methylation domain-containing protein